MDCLYMSDLLTVLLAGGAAIRLLILKMDQRPFMTISFILERMSVGYLLRSSMVFMTSLPDPRPSCERVDGAILTTFQAHRCGGIFVVYFLHSSLDCLFSGHSFLFVTMGLYWWRVNSWFGKLMALGAVMGIYLVVANRAHYTVDVIIAVYMAFFVDYYVRTKREQPRVSRQRHNG